MKNYHYHKELENLWRKAVSYYGEGKKDSKQWFNADETAFLDTIGLSLQEMYDFAEDYCNYQDPDLGTVLLIQDVRKAYFDEVQHGKKSQKVIQPQDLPAKTDSVLDITWLPRIYAKALAKLRGELHSDSMYCCGGDRKFLSTHDIHPATFLRMAWKYENDAQGLFKLIADKKS